MQTAQKMETLDALQSLLAKKPILIDARKINDGGIGTYARNVISDLVGRDIPVALIGNSESIEPYPWSKRVRVIEDHARRYSADEMLSLAKRVDFSSYALFHAPHYTLPFGVPIPTVVTIHDLIHLTHPQRFYYRPVAWTLIASALWRADAVISVSEAARADILKWFPGLVRSRKVGLVPNRLSDNFHELPAAADAGDDDFLFVSVSQPKPHKGILDLLEAFVRAKRDLEALVARGHAPRTALSVELVVAGFGAGKLSESPVVRSYLEGRSDIRIEGSLAVEELRNYYARARAVVVPSRAEGFGFPVIEAHAVGTPVVMRPVPALLEVREEGDFVAADMSSEALVRTLIQAVSANRLAVNDPRRGELRRSALAYDSERAVRPLIDTYSAVLTRSNS